MPNRLRRPFIIVSIQHLFLESLRAFHEFEHYHDRASIFGSFGVYQLPLVVSASFFVVSASFVGVGLFVVVSASFLVVLASFLVVSASLLLVVSASF